MQGSVTMQLPEYSARLKARSPACPAELDSWAVVRQTSPGHLLPEVDVQDLRAPSRQSRPSGKQLHPRAP